MSKLRPYTAGFGSGAAVLAGTIAAFAVLAAVVGFGELPGGSAEPNDDAVVIASGAPEAAAAAASGAASAPARRSFPGLSSPATGRAREGGTSGKGPNGASGSARRGQGSPAAAPTGGPPAGPPGQPTAPPADGSPPDSGTRPVDGAEQAVGGATGADGDLGEGVDAVEEALGEVVGGLVGDRGSRR